MIFNSFKIINLEVTQALIKYEDQIDMNF